MKVRNLLAGAALGFAAATTALAHDLSAGPNGGAFIDTGDTHLEALIQGETLTVFVTDAEDAPIDVTAASGRAILLVGKAKQIVSLSPAIEAGAHVLQGVLRENPLEPPSAILSLKIDGRSVSARFATLVVVSD